MVWPVEVDVLEARHITKGNFVDGNRRCFYYWLGHWFNRQSDEYQKVFHIAKELIGTENIFAWNDDPDRPKAAIAKMINRVTAEVGYTEDPES